MDRKFLCTLHPLPSIETSCVTIVQYPNQEISTDKIHRTSRNCLKYHNSSKIFQHIHLNLCQSSWESMNKKHGSLQNTLKKISIRRLPNPTNRKQVVFSKVCETFTEMFIYLAIKSIVSSLKV